jgi:citrate lyase subunit beta/citryl-CoA lyase
MWSIHPTRFARFWRLSPASDEVAQAAQILAAAAGADWAPISHGGVLHDRASYRYFWQLLERAHQTGQPSRGRKPWFALPA